MNGRVAKLLRQSVGGVQDNQQLRAYRRLKHSYTHSSEPRRYKAREVAHKIIETQKRFSERNKLKIEVIDD